MSRPLTEEQRERRRQQARKRYAKNPEVQRQRTLEWMERNPGKRREVVLKNRCKKYGISSASYLSLLASQAHRCACCGSPFAETSPHIDHCHVTGEVRGLLCSPCNTGIGLFMDDPGRLQEAINYLKSR